MNRETRRTVTFATDFVLPGFTDTLAAGAYEVIAEDERLEGISFDAWRRVSTYLIVRGQGPRRGSVEMRQTSEPDLAALGVSEA